MKTQLFQKIQNMANLILKNDLKVYSVQNLLQRFASVEDQYRHDQVIRNIQRVLEKKQLDNRYATITAEELGKIANEFGTLGSSDNFKAVFVDVLPEVTTSKSDVQEKFLESSRHSYNDDGARIPQKNAELTIDEDESLLLETPKVYGKLFERQDRVSYPVSQNLVKRGMYLIEDEFKGLGYTPRITFATSNKDTLLYTAAVDTEFGQKSIYVPIEMVDEQVLYPTSFATNEKIYEFSKEGVVQFLNDKKAEYFNKRTTQAGITRDNFFTNTVREMTKTAGMEIDENTITETKVKLPEELIPVEAILENSILRKESKFSNEQIDYALALVRDELTRCGYAQIQLKFAGDSINHIKIAAIIQAPEGKFSVAIPVEVANQQVLFPTSFVPTEVKSEVDITDSLYPLTKEGFSKFVVACQENLVPVRYSSEMVDLDFNSLRKIIHKATTEKRYVTAEEALNVIADKYGEEHHATALEDYKGWLLNASLDYKDNYGLGMRASTGVKEPGWEGQLVTSRIMLT